MRNISGEFWDEAGFPRETEEVRIGEDSESATRSHVVIGVGARVGVREDSPGVVAIGEDVSASSDWGDVYSTDAVVIGRRSSAGEGGEDAQRTVTIGVDAASGYITDDAGDEVGGVADGSVVIGDSSESNAVSAVAIGTGSQTTGESAVAIGDGAIAEDDWGSQSTISIGKNCKANTGSVSVAPYGGVDVPEADFGPEGQGATVIGWSAEGTEPESAILGSFAGVDSQGGVAVGFQSEVGVDAQSAIAIGDGASATNAGEAHLSADQLRVGAVDGTIPDTDLNNSEVSFSINETDNEFVVNIKKSDGNVETASVAFDT